MSIGHDDIDSGKVTIKEKELNVVFPELRTWIFLLPQRYLITIRIWICKAIYQCHRLDFHI